MERGLESPWMATFDCVVIDPAMEEGTRAPLAPPNLEKNRNLEIALMVRDCFG
jgi:hypothetical protein